MKKMNFLTLMMAAAILSACNVMASASETDERIESSFLNSFVYKTYLAEEQIKISSVDGAVTLSGTVLVDIHKSMAGDTAEALPGVKSVDNSIKITESHPDEYSDMWLGMKVKATLLYHRNVSGTNTIVDANEGTVTLTGEAANQAQIDLTTKYAQDVTGVDKVKNEMTVVAAPIVAEKTWAEAIDDASITAQVKGALMLNRSTSALKTKVVTNDGRVTISGEAQNAAEKDLVVELVSDIHGVKSIVNDMTVKQ